MDTLFWLPVFDDQVRFLNRPWSWSTLIHWYILVLFVSCLKPNDNDILINLTDLPRCRASDQLDRLTWIWVFGFSEDELLGLCLYPYWCLGLCLLFLCLVDKKNQWLGLCLLLSYQFCYNVITTQSCETKNFSSRFYIGTIYLNFLNCFKSTRMKIWNDLKWI